MKSRSLTKAFGLIVVGLIGAVALQFVLRAPHPAIVENDLVQRIWLGTSIGLEIVGLALLLKSKTRSPG